SAPVRLIAVTTCIFPITLPSPPDSYTLSLHDALPISRGLIVNEAALNSTGISAPSNTNGPFSALPVPRSESSRIATCNGFCSNRSEEHTSELQSRFDLVCRLLLEKKKI